MLKCVIEPKYAMDDMGEKFRTSGKSIMYFADLDLKDAGLRGKVEAMVDMKIPVKKSDGNADSTDRAASASLSTDKAYTPAASTSEAKSEAMHKSSGERWYDTLLAKKRETEPNAQSLTAGDLQQAGVQIAGPYLSSAALAFFKEEKKMSDEAARKALSDICGNSDSAVDKELAVALLDVQTHNVAFFRQCGLRSSRYF